MGKKEQQSLNRENTGQVAKFSTHLNLIREGYWQQKYNKIKHNMHNAVRGNHSYNY